MRHLQLVASSAAALLLLAAAPPDPARAPGDPGESQDQALWTDLRDTQRAMTVERARALHLLYRLQSAGLEKELAARAKAATGEEARRLENLRSRYMSAWGATHAVMTRRWPVDPRLGCRAQAQELGTALRFPSDISPERRQEVRVAARYCLDRITPPVRSLQSALAELSSVMGQVETERKTASSTPSPAAGEGGGS